MTAQDLKNSILQQAIQGKLLPQNPDDEKTFDIPDSWQWVRLGEIINLISCQDLSLGCHNTDGNGVPYITGASNIVDEKIIINRWTTSPTTTAECGDLKGTVGKIAFLKESSAHIARQIMAIKISNFVDKFYIKFFTEKNVQNLKSQAKSMILGISRNNLLMLMFPLPPFAEQKRIVKKLEEILPLVERYGELEQRLTKLDKEFPDKLKKSLLQQAIQGKLTEQLSTDGDAKDLLKKIREEKSKLIAEGKIKKEKPLSPISAEEIPFDIPENWQWARLSDVLDVRDGTHDTPQYVKFGVPLVTNKNLSNETIDFETAKFISQKDADLINAISLIEDGDVLFAMIGTVGNPTLVKKDRNFCIKNMSLFKAINKGLFDTKFLLFFLSLEQYAMKRQAIGGVQSFVSLRFLRKYLIPLPPLAEQKRIVVRLEELLLL